MIKSLNSFGIIPSELIVVSAISAAIDDIRANPWLLDYVFNWFAIDPLTSKVLGQAEKDRAKKWFLNNKIWVTYAGYTLTDVTFPVISVELTNSVENATTLGDVNYDTEEDVDAADVGAPTPNAVIGPFTVESYDQTTGLVTLPEGVSTENLFNNMILVDTHNNIGYKVLAVNSSNTFTIDIATNPNFTNAYIAPIDSFYITKLESAVYKNTFTIFAQAQGEPIYTIYLSTILRFILQRYKEQLLEGRGLDVSSITMGAIYTADYGNPGELTFVQNITLTGLIREYWPGLITPKMQGIKIQNIEIISGINTPLALHQQADDEGWGTIA